MDTPFSPNEGLIRMVEVDPSPVEETPPLPTKKDSYFPPRSTTPPRSSFLGLSGHNLNWWLLRTQRYSSYTFSAYLLAHITNTSLIPLFTRSLPASDTYLLLTRPYYQSPLLEPLLVIAPISIHILSGVALRLHRRRQAVLRYGAESRSDRRRIEWPALSGISALGYILAPLAIGHAFVNRIIPLWVEGGSSGIGLQYVAHGFAKDPWIANIGYVGFVGVGSFHFVWGWAKWMGWTPDTARWKERGREFEWGADEEKEKKSRRLWWGLNGVAAFVAGLWMAGGLGVVGRGGLAGGWVGRGFDELYRRIPILGRRY